MLHKVIDPGAQSGVFVPFPWGCEPPMSTVVVVHEIYKKLDSLDAIAFGDNHRRWIIFGDHVTLVQRIMLRPHIETALGCPDAGVQGLTIPFGAALTMELTPYTEEDLLPPDGPGDYPTDGDPGRLPVVRGPWA